MAFIVGELSSLCGWFCAKGRRVRGSLGRGDCVKESRSLYGFFSCFGGSGERDQEDKWITRLVSADEPSPLFAQSAGFAGFPRFWANSVCWVEGLK